MEKIFDLVPKDKSDVSGIEALRRIEIEDAEPILISLLAWVQDLNWPVAQELIKVLPRFHRQLIPHIQSVFRSNDDIWKNWILVMLRDFPPETVLLMAEDIKRLAHSPTDAELLEETNEYALEVLTRFDF